jgi:uncharacterized protein (DUF2267 family)
VTTTKVAAFDRTFQKTQGWLSNIVTELGWDDLEQGYVALRAVLHALRDRLPPDEAAHLAAQLPMLVRGFYYEGWHPAHKPLKYRDKASFLQEVQKKAPNIRQEELEAVISTVFHELSNEITPGEIDDVRQAMPEPVRELWARAGM